ncbi:ABC transporter ATP-binding protein [Microbacteriaceae bacterium VKM Ac-2854]|nr:ABC transporter ATP-binding protein [Microbacteriaceae bacterium VKM Ac-2854]
MTDSIVARASGLTKKYGSFTAVDGVDFGLRENAIHGLLGRNGAGKTTLMQLLTGQVFPDAGTLEVFGHAPAENAEVLSHTCFISEAQKYPDGFKASHVLATGPLFFENWDADLAAQLVDDFQLPLNRPIKKLSRGQLSAVGVIVGLAARARLTFFDEPYLGLDAVARRLFYDRLLSDYAEHPRTIVLSTHLIDEAADLLEHVIVIDGGRILIDASAEELRGSATTVVGRRSDVDVFVAGRPVLARDGIGGLASVTIQAQLTPGERREATERGLELAPVSLQQLIVHRTSGVTLETASNGVLS